MEAQEFAVLHQPSLLVLTSPLSSVDNRTTVTKLMFRFMQNWTLMSYTKARLPKLLNTIMQTLLANSSWSTKITGNADTFYARAHFAI
jgi:hypothetical protein